MQCFTEHFITFSGQVNAIMHEHKCKLLFIIYDPIILFKKCIFVVKKLIFDLYMRRCNGRHVIMLPKSVDLVH